MRRDGLYKMGTFARLVGLSPLVLRAWETRFSILEPERGPKGHRLYTDDDLLVIRRIQALLAGGRSIGEVAHPGRRALLEQARSGEALAGIAASTPVAVALERLPRGQRTAAPSLERAVAELVEAAGQLDEPRFVRALDEAFACLSPELAIETVLVPAARRIGTLWAEGRLSVAGEHLASGLLMERLQKLLDSARPTNPAAPVALCASLPDDWHQAGPLVVAYRLARLGWRAVFLGAALPLEDLERACERLAPRLVCLSVAREAVLATHLPGLAELVRRRSKKVTFWIGGQGATGDLASLERAGARVWAPERSLTDLSDLVPTRRGSSAG